MSDQEVTESFCGSDADYVQICSICAEIRFSYFQCFICGSCEKSCDCSEWNQREKFVLAKK